MLMGRVLLSLFLFLFIQSAFFTHTHIVNGFAKTHSHIYFSNLLDGVANTATNHTHSKEAYIIIDLLNNITYLVGAVGVFILSVKVLRKLYHFADKSIKPLYKITAYLRGPPIFSIFSN